MTWGVGSRGDWSRPLTIGLIGGLLMFGIGFRRASGRVAATPTTELRVPRAKTPPKIDGELDELAWTKAPARTGAFVASDGVAAARPFSEARVLWDETNLYVALYAADEDIRVANVPPDGPVWTGDAFRLLFTRADGSVRAIDVGPSGTITDAAAEPGQPLDYAWQSAAKAAVDLDGTANDPSDQDEEWVVEMAIPMSALGLTPRNGERIGFAVRRCDTALSRRSCGSWPAYAAHGVLVLE